jgi:hypothetical protein
MARVSPFSGNFLRIVSAVLMPFLYAFVCSWGSGVEGVMERSGDVNFGDIGMNWSDWYGVE